MIKIVAVMIVRNEADLLRVNVDYHAAQGVTGFRIIDNDSSDATGEHLREMSERLNIDWSRNDGPYRQSEMMTGLAADAFRAGADWIVPIDADEFWSAGDRSLAEALEASNAGAIEVDVVNFVQQRDGAADGAASLLTMTHRVGAPFPSRLAPELVDSGQFAFVEAEYPAKWVARASAGVRFGAGAHAVAGTTGACQASSAIVCLHAPIRSRRVLDARAEHGRRLIEGGYPPDHGWQNQRWHHLQAENKLDDEWNANSARDGHLEVRDRRTPLVFDSRLRDAVRPWISRD